MWELGNLWADGKGTSMANSYLSVMHEVHVLLVDHDSESLVHTTQLLEICQYRVTFVELASAAIQMLASGKAKFDIVMANINSPDLHGFKLLQQAVNMDIPIILMSVDDNTFMAVRALENGAFLYIKKPAAAEMLRCVWQHVLREKTRTIRERDRFVTTSYSVRGIEFMDAVHNSEDDPNNIGGSNMLTMNDKGKSKKKVKGRNGVNGEEEYDYPNNQIVINNGKVKRKVCTEWTQELHRKFMDAVEQLGEGRCFPKEILELMDVPGLTRMQVASHLQKCRNDNWRSPEERRAHLAIQPVSSDTDGSQNKPRRFGSMPRLAKTSSHHTCDPESTGGVGQGSKNSNSETQIPSDVVGIGIDISLGTGSVVTNTTHHNHLQHYGPLVLHPNINTTTAGTTPNPRHASDDFYSSPDMECLIQNFSGLPQGSAGMMMIANPNSGSGGYHYGPVYHDQQNSAMPNMETRSQWSSDQTSNFGSDESYTRSHH